MKKLTIALLIVFTTVLFSVYAEGSGEQKAASVELSGVDPSNVTITY